MTRRLPDRIPACLAVMAHSLLRTHDQPFYFLYYSHRHFLLLNLVSEMELELEMVMEFSARVGC